MAVRSSCLKWDGVYTTPSLPGDSVAEREGGNQCGEIRAMRDAVEEARSGTQCATHDELSAQHQRRSARSENHEPRGGTGLTVACRASPYASAGSPRAEHPLPFDNAIPELYRFHISLWCASKGNSPREPRGKSQNNCDGEIWSERLPIHDRTTGHFWAIQRKHYTPTFADFDFGALKNSGPVPGRARSRESSCSFLSSPPP